MDWNRPPREVGAELTQEILDLLRGGNTVILDFEGRRIASSGFLDEIAAVSLLPGVQIIRMNKNDAEILKTLQDRLDPDRRIGYK